MTRYVEFAVASNFSFLRGASHPEELVMHAGWLGLDGIGLCDRNTVAGVVRAYALKRHRDLALRYHPGTRLVFADNTPDILAYPRDLAAWGNLCRLLTRGNLRAEKGDCILLIEDLIEHIDGLELIVMDRATRDLPVPPIEKWKTSPPPEAPPPVFGKAKLRLVAGLKKPPLLSRLNEAAPGRVRLAASMLYRGHDRRRLAQRQDAARSAGVPLIAVNDVFYHGPERRELQDVLTCIREHLTLDTAGRRLAVNDERHLKPPQEMARLFVDAPQAIEETLKLDAVLGFDLKQLKYDYPDESLAGFATAHEAIEHLAWDGARWRYPDGIPDIVRTSLAAEFTLIRERQYASYFLTVYDIVRYARSEGILCQGRGSAANSTVCYCLGITSVDPAEGNSLFERFMSTERDEPPDIDVDFEHERREEVIQYIYEKYGRERAGITATVINYRGRSAIREVGKAYGLSEDTIGALSSSIWGMGGGAVREEELKRAGIDVDAPRMMKMRELVGKIQGFPRHLSQHVGGFVITRKRLDDMVPIMNGAMDERTHIEWNKDDLDALEILKVDVLGLGMLTCIKRAFEFAEKHYGLSFTTPMAQRRGSEPVVGYDLSTVPKEKPPVYDMLCRADSIGVFQVESRAQMSMLPRLKPRKMYDLVIEVAIVRPGPIQGDMVHPYLTRRKALHERGIEPDYPRPGPGLGDPDELKNILGKTLGVPLFQEQAMKIAMDAGGFTGAEADKLRRAMATFKRTGTIGSFHDKMVNGMAKKGYDRDFAERCFSQIEGFGEYGFPESHAASFALLVYASAWLKCFYPDVFAAALLNSQPMGFYAPAQIVRDVQEHGVDVRPVDINHSDWFATLEPENGLRAAERLHALHTSMKQVILTTHAMRLGFQKIKGMKEDHGLSIMKHRGAGYASVRDLWLRTGLPQSVIERLADADAFGSLGLTRREALWAAKALGRVGDEQDTLPLFSPPLAAQEKISLGGKTTASHQEPTVALPLMPQGEEVVNDYRFLSLSLREHPASFIRADLAARRIVTNETLRDLNTGTRVRVSGLVTIRQRPGTAAGVVFMTIEDETSIANIIVWRTSFEQFRPIILGARYVGVEGIVQHESGVIHVVAERLVDLTSLLGRLAEDNAAVESLSRTDEVKHGPDELDGRSRKRSVMPELLAGDLDVTAPGSAHAPLRRGGTQVTRKT